LLLEKISVSNQVSIVTQICFEDVQWKSMLVAVSMLCHALDSSCVEGVKYIIRHYGDKKKCVIFLLLCVCMFIMV
jgi:hypothetical protein